MCPQRGVNVLHIRRPFHQVLSQRARIPLMRGFNIDSLVVCRTEIRDLSKMCIVLRGQDGIVEQARWQLEDLVSRCFPQ